MTQTKLAPLLLACLALALPASAAEPPHDAAGVTVTGSGEVMVRPDTMELELQAAADAELTGDATTKYETAVRRITAAINAAGIEGLKIEQRGIRITDRPQGGAGNMPGLAAGGNKPAPGKTHTSIARSLRLVVAGIDQHPDTEVIATIGKLVDAAKDAGAAIGPENANSTLMAMMGRAQADTPLVTFVVADPRAARERAYRQAFDDATERAGRLAALSKSSLGRVLAVDELAASSHGGPSLQEAMITEIYGIGGAKKTESRLTSQSLEEIPVRVSLRVRFAVEEKVDEQ
jgi:uncharacterized protein YggE